MNPQIHDEATRLQHYIAGLDCLMPQITNISIRSNQLQELFTPIQNTLAHIIQLNEGASSTKDDVGSADTNTHGGIHE